MFTSGSGSRTARGLRVGDARAGGDEVGLQRGRGGERDPGGAAARAAGRPPLRVRDEVGRGSTRHRGSGHAVSLGGAPRRSGHRAEVDAGLHLDVQEVHLGGLAAVLEADVATERDRSVDGVDDGAVEEHPDPRRRHLDGVPVPLADRLHRCRERGSVGGLGEGTVRRGDGGRCPRRRSSRCSRWSGSRRWWCSTRRRRWTRRRRRGVASRGRACGRSPAGRWSPGSTWCRGRGEFADGAVGLVAEATGAGLAPLVEGGEGAVEEPRRARRDRGRDARVGDQPADLDGVEVEPAHLLGPVAGDREGVGALGERDVGGGHVPRSPSCP